MSETSPSEATGSKLESMEPTSDFAKDTNCELPTISVTSVSENSSSSSKSSTNKKAVTTDYTDQALHEMPKIKNGVQHLLTIALAKLHLQNQNGDKTLVMNKDIAKCIGMLLINKINTFTLPNIQEWVRMNPRTNERTKEERMEDLSKYGCIHSLQLLARSRKKNATEFFGKNYFVWTNVWANIRDSIFEDESENPTLDRNLLKFALTLFGKSLSAKDDDYGDDMCLVWNVHCFDILKARHSKLHEAQELRKGIDDFTHKVEDKTLVGMRPDRARKPGDEEDIDESESGTSTPRDVQLSLLLPSPAAMSTKSSFSPLSTIFGGSQASPAPSPALSATSELMSPEKSSSFSRILSGRFLSSPSKP